MLSTALVIFRESLEIALILGIILAATKELPGRMKWITGGVAAGIAGAGLIALFAEAISSAATGMGQELFNAAILFTAALVIGWTVLWMRAHARQMSAKFKQVGQKVADGRLPFYSLSLIIALSILREGAEIVLFIYGMLLSGQSGASIAGGGTLGFLLGTGAGALLYYGLVKFSAGHMLKVTSWLLMLLVAGLASQGAGYLSAAGYFTHFSAPVWDSSWLLTEDGLAGKSLHSLIGYTAKPSLIQIAFYGVTLSVILLFVTMIDRRHKPA